jgi:MFS family permease
VQFEIFKYSYLHVIKPQKPDSMKPKKSLNLIMLILAGEVIFFLPFMLPRIFRPTLLSTLNITNLELGGCFSLYGIIAMVSYFFGGPLADKFKTGHLIGWALILTGLGGVALFFSPSLPTLFAVYGYWGFTTIFLFWAALIKATRIWGGDNLQGKAFGLLEGGRGATAAIVGALAVAFFANSISNAESNSYLHVVLYSSFFTMFIGVLALVIFGESQTVTKKNDLTLSQIKSLLLHKGIWFQAIIIICAYVGYKSTDDLSLYANQVLNFNEVDSARIGSTALWLRPLFAILAGYLADKFDGLNIIKLCFVVMILGACLIFTGTFESIIVLSLVNMAAMLTGVYGLRGVYFAVMKDSKVPLALTGTAVGLMSVIGYTPDVFMSPLMGVLLDNYPGAEGHRYLFLVCGLFGSLGFLATQLLKRNSNPAD